MSSKDGRDSERRQRDEIAGLCKLKMRGGAGTGNERGPGTMTSMREMAEKGLCMDPQTGPGRQKSERTVEGLRGHCAPKHESEKE